MSDLERDAAVLAQHWREATGMTPRSPDRCACGVRTRPAEGDEDILDRRARAFAQHQAEMLGAARSNLALSTRDVPPGGRVHEPGVGWWLRTDDGTEFGCWRGSVENGPLLPTRPHRPLAVGSVILPPDADPLPGGGYY